MASPPGSRRTGAACVLIGTAGALVAQRSVGDSWRVGLDETETTARVTAGLFVWACNPIFSFMGLSLLGSALLVPNVLACMTAGFSNVAPGSV